MSYNIAVDGPAGAGKSTIAKEIAKKMNLIYIDTGAMYRAMALFLLREGIGPEDLGAIGEKCVDADITIRYGDRGQVVYLNGENVNLFLRTEEVGSMASAAAVNPEVRKRMVELQKQLAADNDCIMDGRDIGTCVLPDADVKIYLTADVGERAKRRYVELQGRGVECDVGKIRADIEERDYRDKNREHSPLKQAEDAVLVDTSQMTIDEAVTAIIRICESRAR